MLVFIFFLFSQIFQISQSATVLVDGVSKWSNPNVQVGDSVIFEHKYGYKLYIFQNQIAFSSCNFTRATLLTKNNSTSYIWHPSRPGFFYFSFNNGTDKACQEGQKLAIKVSLTSPPSDRASSPQQSPPSNQASSPEQSPPLAAPPVSSGGVVSSSPAYPWPFKPRDGLSPGPAPSTMFPASSPMVPEKGGGGIPFINSNPAVPLPTGEVDSATIHPLPTSSHRRTSMVGLIAVQGAVCCVISLILL